MKDAFNAYRKYAWMADEFKPVSDRGENGLTIIDSLDTLYLMSTSQQKVLFFMGESMYLNTQLGFSEVYCRHIP